MNNLLVLADCCFNALKYLKHSVELLVVKRVYIYILFCVDSLQEHSSLEERVEEGK